MVVLRIYRRHILGCEFTSEHERRCQCPIHAEGYIGDQKIKRHSLKITDRKIAQKRIAEWEVAGVKTKPRVTLKQAIADYRNDCQARELEPSTTFKIDVLLSRLSKFADTNGLLFIGDLGVPELRKFRATWETWGPVTQRKNIDRLRSFMRWTAENKWTDPLPKGALKYPEVEPTEVTIFTEEELK